MCLWLKIRAFPPKKSHFLSSVKLACFMCEKTHKFFFKTNFQVSINYSSYRCNKPTWDVGRTVPKLVNHSPPARDSQAFLLFSQHPTWAYYAGKATLNAVYCLMDLSNMRFHYQYSRLATSELKQRPLLVLILLYSLENVASMNKDNSTEARIE